MKHVFATTAVVVTLAIAAGVAHAKHVQQFGRDSVYAVRGNSETNRPASTAASDAPSVQPYGRGSVYASNRQVSTTSVSAYAINVQPYGRGSVYAIQLDKNQTPGGSTAIGTAEQNRAYGG